MKNLVRLAELAKELSALERVRVDTLTFKSRGGKTRRAELRIPENASISRPKIADRVARVLVDYQHRYCDGLVKDIHDAAAQALEEDGGEVGRSIRTLLRWLEKAGRSIVLVSEDVTVLNPSVAFTYAGGVDVGLSGAEIDLNEQLSAATLPRRSEILQEIAQLTSGA